MTKSPPIVGEVWKTRGGYWVHLLEKACGPFPLIGRVFLRNLHPGEGLRMAGPLWAFSLEGVSCDAADRGFDLVERTEGKRLLTQDAADD